MKYRAGSPPQGLEATTSAAELDRSPLYNLVVRALVKEGEMQPAVALLERMVMSDGSLVAQGATVRDSYWPGLIVLLIMCDSPST